jgi:hypothetical protein
MNSDFDSSSIRRDDVCCFKKVKTITNKNMKQIIITILFALVAMTWQGQEITGRVMLTDSIAIRTDSLCQRNVMCNHDTIRKDSCQQQHRLSFVRKEQIPAWSISPNAVKMQKFDPYIKKFTDMRIIETIGSHISR